MRIELDINGKWFGVKYSEDDDGFWAESGKDQSTLCIYLADAIEWCIEEVRKECKENMEFEKRRYENAVAEYKNRLNELDACSRKRTE